MKNIQVNYEEGAAEFAEWLFGRAVSNEELAAAVGALDDSQLNVRIRKGVELAIEIENVKVVEQVRFIRRDPRGELMIWNFRFEKARGHHGVGLESLLRQIKGARSLGIRRLECWAAGDPKDTRYTGYYRWASYGFDAPLNRDEQEVLSQDPQYAGVASLNELMMRGGREWWRKYGSERKMIFVLNENSSMMAVLRNYLSEKRPDLLKELI